MGSRRQRGAHFEDVACTYLKAKGYRILERNVYLLRKELDIVALDGDTVVFVEVKGRLSTRYGVAAEAVGSRKRGHMVKVAEAYMGRKGLWGKPCRFDVVCVGCNAHGTRSIEHIKDAFGVSG